MRSKVDKSGQKSALPQNNFPVEPLLRELEKLKLFQVFTLFQLFQILMLTLEWIARDKQALNRQK